jgi:putative DNA primase/helicase
VSALHDHLEPAAVERLAADYCDRLRHVRGIGWLSWDGTRWAPGEDAAQEAAKANAATLLLEAAERGDPKRAAAAARLYGWPRIRGALALASTDPRISVSADTLDADPWLLNCANGVVDLRDGTLTRHRPELYMTKIAGAEYWPDARSERWDRHMTRVTGGDVELAAYTQRAGGYAATGLTIEEVVLFAYGPQNSGKTTTLEALRAALGGYATTTGFSTLLAGRRTGEAATPGVAALQGIRLACASEVSNGARFDTARLKLLAGGERIPARPLYRDPYEFDPTHTLWLAANERPGIPAGDGAAWRRVRLLPFEHVLPNVDEHFKRALVENPDERAAVLAWIVRGAVAWREKGLGSCAAVAKATAEYRRDNDPLRDWLATCRRGDDLSTRGGELRATYERWCRRSGQQPCSPHDFASGLESHGLSRDRTKRGIVWRGLAVYPVQSVQPDPQSTPIRARMSNFPQEAAPATPATPAPENRDGSGADDGASGVPTPRPVESTGAAADADGDEGPSWDGLTDEAQLETDATRGDEEAKERGLVP